MLHTIVELDFMARLGRLVEPDLTVAALAPATLAPAAGFSPYALNLDDQAGGTFADKPIFTLGQITGQLDSGSLEQANAGVITYSFTDLPRLTGLYNNPHPVNGVAFASFGYSPFSAVQREAARGAVQLWDDLVAVTFVERNGVGADIQFANNWNAGQAYTFLPAHEGWKVASDVFVMDPALNWTNNWLRPGGYGMTTLIHEIGHSLGFEHPGAYNAAAGPPQPFTYANYAEYAQDSDQYTIMSYFSMANTSNQPFQFGLVDFSTLFYNNPQTPLLHDIYAIQALFGADSTTRAGDTVYGWNATAGNAIYDFSKNLFPWLAIYDAGGNDTIDMSGANASVYINLNDGAFSSGAAAVPSAAVINAISEEIDAVFPGTLEPVDDATADFFAALVPELHAPILEFETGVSGLGVTAHDNLSIAYGTVIENATGSSQRDYLVGNEAGNVLRGLGGDDVLSGGAGADTLHGGAGADSFVVDRIESGDRIADFETADSIDLTGTGIDFTWIGAAGFSGSAGELRFAGGRLEGDVNGDRLADLAIAIAGDPIAEANLILI